MYIHTYTTYISTLYGRKIIIEGVSRTYHWGPAAVCVVYMCDTDGGCIVNDTEFRVCQDEGDVAEGTW